MIEYPKTTQSTYSISHFTSFQSWYINLCWKLDSEFPPFFPYYRLSWDKWNELVILMSILCNNSPGGHSSEKHSPVSGQIQRTSRSMETGCPISYILFDLNFFFVLLIKLPLTYAEATSTKPHWLILTSFHRHFSCKHWMVVMIRELFLVLWV